MNEIHLFGVIGRTRDGEGITAQQVKTQLASIDQSEPLIVRIDSEGGSVFDGLSIYEAFANYPGPKKAVIESTAFSIASYIAMAFDEVEIAENGYVMIHEPSSSVDGTATDLAKNADLLAKLDQSMVAAYAKKTGLSEEEARTLMQDETFMNASEALAWGFVNRINDSKVKTRITPQARHQNMPQRVFTALFGAGSDDGDKSVTTKEQSMADTQRPVAASLREIKSAFPKMKAEFYVTCLEKELPMASVASAAVEELMAENEEMKARIAAMEDEEEARAKAMDDDEEEAKAKAESDEEAKAESDDEYEAKAKAKAGVKPITRAHGAKTKTTATASWHEVVQACLPRTGGNKMKAVALANRENPGLRERMLAEANRR
jgi:ATP-dependent protease ClpP protease subunit